MIFRVLEPTFLLLWIHFVIVKGNFEICSVNNSKHVSDSSRNIRLAREPDRQRKTLLNDSGSCGSPCAIGFTGCRCNIPCASSPIGCPYGCDGYGGCMNCNHCRGGQEKCVGKPNIYGKWVYACVDGCLEGWFGNKCDKTCSEISKVENCTKCRQLSLTYYECVECIAGLYLTDNGINSSERHDITSGLTSSHAYVIEVGNTQACVPCNSGCRSCGPEVTCESDTGNCKFGCIDRHEGKKCDNFCRNRKCLQCKPKSSEECLLCETGWSGRFCSEACHINCINNTCDSATGLCTLGCLPGWTGQYWNVTCCQFCYEENRNACLSCIQEFGDNYCNINNDNRTKLALHKITIYSRLPVVTMATISTGVTIFLISFGIIYAINSKRSKTLHRPLVADKRQTVLQNTYIDFSHKEYFM